MTVQGTETLRGSLAAYPSQEPWPSAGFTFLADQELPWAREWPLISHLELPAQPRSAGSARRHARNILREWRLETLTDTVELLVSELITNAVRATAMIPPPAEEPGPDSEIRFWLTSDRQRALIQVWDGDHNHPVRQDDDWDAEAGRGLLLVETLSVQWGCCVTGGQAGKVVWALCAE